MGRSDWEQNDEKLNGTKVRTKESFPNTFTGRVCMYVCMDVWIQFEFDGIKTSKRTNDRKKKKN